MCAVSEDRSSRYWPRSLLLDHALYLSLVPRVSLHILRLTSIPGAPEENLRR